MGSDPIRHLLRFSLSCMNWVSTPCSPITPSAAYRGPVVLASETSLLRTCFQISCPHHRGGLDQGGADASTTSGDIWA